VESFARREGFHPDGLTVHRMGRTNATACYRELGAELKKRRDTAGLTGDDIARATGWHRSKVSRVELGNAEISVVDAIHYLGACKVFATEAQELLELCRDAERKLGYWLSPHGEWLEDTLSSLIYHESAADRSISFEPVLVPGLLQTPAYARARIATGTLDAAAIELAVQSRMDRRQVLRRPRPAQFTFFVHEHALRLRVGSGEVMQEQLLQLVLLAALDHVTLRVIPARAGELSVFGGPFRLFEYRDHAPLAYVDNIASGLFLDDPDFVEDYRRLIPKLAAVALDEGQSRSFAATLADEFDRGSRKRDAAIYELEEEHLQRPSWQ
jgi:transcriptional regulator with XRE-family HTH domain